MVKRTFFVVLLVVAALVGLYFIPQFSVDGYSFRQVNILFDVMVDTAVADTPEVKAKPVYVAYKDSVPKGMIPIEDFRDSLGKNREMDKFYEALCHAKEKPVRIAYFGDSFIEGDILTAQIRELLQAKFGGCGVGFIDIHSQIAGFRTTVIELSKGWTEYDIIHHSGKGFNKSLQGINSRYYIPAGGAYIEARGQQRVFPSHLDTAQVATVYFTPKQGLTMRSTINGKNSKPLYFCADSIGDSIEACSLTGKIGRVKVEVNGNGRFYGMALEGKSGIALDNFSMRGSIGWHLGQIPVNVLKQFANLRHYDLIIMHFGLNMATPTTKHYTAFCNKFKEGIDDFREAYPDASLLVVSISNRDVRGTNGEFRTMKGVIELVEAQREMAKEEGIAFWNLQQGMGGSGSMERMQKEGKANRDYTHINFKGGEAIGRIFFDALMNGKMNFDLRKGNVTKEQLRSEVKHFVAKPHFKIKRNHISKPIAHNATH